MTRPWIVLCAALFVASGWLQTPASAAGSFACEKEHGSQAVIDACAARWTASNLRAHVATGRYSDRDVANFLATAERLETLATQWASSGKSTLFAEKLPAIANADDDVLAAACPGNIWTYANQGSPPCAYALNKRVAVETKPVSPATAAPADGPAHAGTAPATCYARPADEPELLGLGLYWWDSAECAQARSRWEAAHTRAAVSSESQPSSSSETLSSTRLLSPTQEIDKSGFAFVTDGLAQPPRNLQSVWLPKGTLFPVHTMQSYSTFEARLNGKLRFELDQDVVVNGLLVAMKGDAAEGSFPAIMPGRSSFFGSRSDSSFQVTIDAMYNFCGDKIDVDFDRTEYRGANMDLHIIRGQEYVSFTSRPQRVCGISTTEANSPIPSTALYTTTH